MVEIDKNEWEKHLRSLSSVGRDPNLSATDPSLLNTVKRVCELCKEDKSEDLIARVYPHFIKIFQRTISSISHFQTSTALLLLAILQFFLDFADVVLHDPDSSLRIFFRSCLSREFADPSVAEATLDFLNANKNKFSSSFPSLLPQVATVCLLITKTLIAASDDLNSTTYVQYFPLLLKLVTWNGEKLEQSFLKIFSLFISNGSFLPLFPSLVDLPILIVALEKVEKSSGSLVGDSIASVQKSNASEMLLALMDEAYTGSTIGDGGVDSESEDNDTMGVADPLFLELLKDENDGLAERHWTSPAMAAALQQANTASQSTRLKQALRMAPRFLDVYFSVAVCDVDNSLICALIPLVMARYSTLFPDKNFAYEVQKRLIEFMLAAFHRSPDFIALLKKPIVDRLGEAYDSPSKTELALQLCWAIGEHGGGGRSHKDAARELFESLELLLYENLSSSRVGLPESTVGSGGPSFRKASQSRLLCFVVTAIARLATYHRELLPRARVSLAKVARSRISDENVSRRACDYLGLMNEPPICLSILGPSRPSNGSVQDPGTVNWNKCDAEMIAHIPFHILRAQKGPPYHDFSYEDILPRK